MKIEPAISAYRSVRKKQHGIGEGSRLRAIKMALFMFCATNGTYQHWYARLAFWLALYGTPQLPPTKPGGYQ
jgi:hypothetical protein